MVTRDYSGSVSLKSNTRAIQVGYLRFCLGWVSLKSNTRAIQVGYAGLFRVVLRVGKPTEYYCLRGPLQVV
jgi:hypothetical protein